MKAVISMLALASTLLLSSQAQASWYQSYCRTADGTLEQASGHNDFYFNATVRTWSNEGVTTSKLALEDVSIEELQTQDLETENNQVCQPGQNVGFGSWRSVSYAKIRITNTDGSLFSEDVVGVTADRTAIEASWICETNGNSMIPCGE